MSIERRVGGAIGGPDRGISPVFGVVLLAALVVALAVVGGVLVFEAADRTSAPAQAGVNVDQKGSGPFVSEVTVTVVSLQEADAVTLKAVEGTCGGVSVNASAVGTTAEIGGCSPGDEVVVVATRDGSRSVIERHVVE